MFNKLFGKGTSKGKHQSTKPEFAHASHPSSVRSSRESLPSFQLQQSPSVVVIPPPQVGSKYNRRPQNPTSYHHDLPLPNGYVQPHYIQHIQQNNYIRCDQRCIDTKLNSYETKRPPADNFNPAKGKKGKPAENRTSQFYTGFPEQDFVARTMVPDYGDPNVVQEQKMKTTPHHNRSFDSTSYDCQINSFQNGIPSTHGKSLIEVRPMGSDHDTIRAPNSFQTGFPFGSVHGKSMMEVRPVTDFEMKRAASQFLPPPPSQSVIYSYNVTDGQFVVPVAQKPVGSGTSTSKLRKGAFQEKTFAVVDDPVLPHSMTVLSKVAKLEQDEYSVVTNTKPTLGHTLSHSSPEDSKIVSQLESSTNLNGYSEKSESVDIPTPPMTSHPDDRPFSYSFENHDAKGNGLLDDSELARILFPNRKPVPPPRKNRKGNPFRRSMLDDSDQVSERASQISKGVLSKSTVGSFDESTTSDTYLKSENSVVPNKTSETSVSGRLTIDLSSTMQTSQQTSPPDPTSKSSPSGSDGFGLDIAREFSKLDLNPNEIVGHSSPIIVDDRSSTLAHQASPRIDSDPPKIENSSVKSNPSSPRTDNTILRFNQGSPRSDHSSPPRILSLQLSELPCDDQEVTQPSYHKPTTRLSSNENSKSPKLGQIGSSQPKKPSDCEDCTLSKSPHKGSQRTSSKERQLKEKPGLAKLSTDFFKNIFSKSKSKPSSPMTSPSCDPKPAGLLMSPNSDPEPNSPHKELSNKQSVCSRLSSDEDRFGNKMVLENNNEVYDLSKNVCNVPDASLTLDDNQNLPNLLNGNLQNYNDQVLNPEEGPSIPVRPCEMRSSEREELRSPSNEFQPANILPQVPTDPPLASPQFDDWNGQVNGCLENEDSTDKSVPSMLRDKGQQHELVVFHRLHGSVSKSLVHILEESTSEEVIKMILRLERLPPNHYLYQLVTKTLDTRFRGDGVTEIESQDFPLRHLKQKIRGGNIRFELQQKQGIQIKVVWRAENSKPATLMFSVSCEADGRGVIEDAIGRFGLTDSSPDDLCLIQVNKNCKENPMRKLKECQILSELQSDYFLLCEKENLAHPSEDRFVKTGLDSPMVTPDSKSSTTRSLYNHQISSPSSLLSKLSSMEKEFAEKEKAWERRLKRNEQKLELFQTIALCRDTNKKIYLLDSELQRLTQEMQFRELQVEQARQHCDHFKSTSRLEKPKELTDHLRDEEQGLFHATLERQEICRMLEAVKLERSSTSLSQETQKLSLYEICSNGHKFEGNLFCLELSKVEWNNFLFQSSQQNKEDLIVCESDATGALKPGDRILEINSQLIQQSSEKGPSTAWNVCLEDTMRVVVLRQAGLEAASTC